MQWFFIVSGYIYFSRKERYLSNPKNFLKTRFIDLMIPYLILGPVIWFGKFTLSAYVKNQVSLNDLADMFVTPIAFMWFIYVLFFVEIIIFLIDKIANWRWEATLCLLFIIYVTLHLTIGRGKDVFNLTFYYLFWYYLGGIFVYYKEFIENRAKQFVVWGGILWIALFTVHIFIKDTPADRINGVIYRIASTFYVCLFFKLYDAQTKTNFLLNYLGNKTIYIYILNPIIINGLRQILVKMNITNIGVSFFTFFFGALVIACVIGEIGKRFAPVGFIFSPRKYIIKKDKI